MTQSNDLVYSLRNVGIRYDVQMARSATIREELARRFARDKARSGKRSFWALRDVSFALREGETLGVIGRNGSGKSTLLLSLAGILAPDRGTLRVEGRPMLLTLAAGFDNRLSGRDNILLNAAFLGFTRERAKALIEPVIEFSELGDFINAPVRQYSSGMKTRLAFAIAVNVEPDILLLDEILGVGDTAFQEKSKARLRELMERARALVIVTQAPTVLTEICTKALWLHEGRIMEYGDPADVSAQYREASKLGWGRRAVRAVS